MAARAIGVGLWALSVAAGAAQVGPPAAEASPSVLAPAFGNSLVSTYPDGRVSKLWLDPGGGFTGQNRKGEPNAGRWTVVGARLCMKQYRPFFIPFSYCTPLLTGPPPAEGWKAKAPTGEPIVVRLVKGRP